MPQFDIKEKTNLVFSLDTKYEAVEGTNNYNELINKPSINDVTLIGDLTSSDLKIPTLDSFERIDNQVTDLASTVNNHSSSIAKNTSDIQTNTNNITANANAIQKNTNDIATNASNIASNTQAIQANADNISANTSSINSLSSTKADKTYVDSQVSSEVTNRENADNQLQSQIDALTSKSDVVDIVGTYAQLIEYDTSTLANNDIIKVLEDSTHDNAMSYYRWNSASEEWSYIGSEGAYYTKSESDTRFVPVTRTINNKALSSNITLIPSDVGAQEQLISGSNIKTINNESLLGSTNIELPTKAYVDSSVATKQDTLVSGSNIKTINNESLLGSGDIVLPTTTEIETLIASKLKAITNEEIDEIMGV